MAADDDGWLWRWINNGRGLPRSIADAPTGISLNFCFAKSADFAFGMPSGTKPVSSDAIMVPSGAKPVSSDAIVVPSGAKPVSSDAIVVPSGAKLVPSGAFMVPSGTNLVSSDTFMVPSGANSDFYGSLRMPKFNVNDDQVCARRFHMGVKSPLGIFCEGTVNPTCKLGIERYCCCGACSKKILVTVLSSTVRNNLLICFKDFNNKACFINVSVVNAFDILWTFGSGGGKRKRDDAITDGCNDSFKAPWFGYIQSPVGILLHSEGKHSGNQELYLHGDHVNGLLTGVATFVAKKNIRKVAVLPAYFTQALAQNPNVDPIRYSQVYKSNFDILLASVSENRHWYLIAFFVNTRKVSSFDSLKAGPPRILETLKACVESVMHIQFEYEDKSDTVTLQRNGYDCGVHAFRMGEQICFTGENRLFEIFHAEAERARAREILRMLKNNEIGDEWVRPVQNATDFVDLNKPIDVEENTEGNTKMEVDSKDDDSDIEWIDSVTEKVINKNTVIKKEKEVEIIDLEEDFLNNAFEERQIVNDNNDFEPLRYNFLQKDLKIILPTEEYEEETELYLSGDQVIGVIFAAAEFVVKKNIRRVAVLPPNYAAILGKYPETDPKDFFHVLNENFDIILAPVCQHNHWYLTVFTLATKKVTVYNSKMTGVPAIFDILKTNIEKHLNIIFEFEDKNATMNYQKNGFDCGIFCTKKAEQICFYGESKRLPVFYVIAERARVKEIIQKLAFDGCTNEWFPFVKNENDYLDSTEHLKVRDPTKKVTGILHKIDSNFEIAVEYEKCKDTVTVEDNDVNFDEISDKTKEIEITAVILENKYTDGDHCNKSMNDEEKGDKNDFIYECDDGIIKAEKQKETYQCFLKRKKVRKNKKNYEIWKSEQQTVEERIAELQKKKSDEKERINKNAELKKLKNAYDAVNKLSEIDCHSYYVHKKILSDLSKTRQNATIEDKKRETVLKNEI